jgi:uncharacterized protein (DUF885 family)
MRSHSPLAAVSTAAPLIFCLFLSACPAERENSAAVFKTLVDEYVKWRLEAMPNWATSVGCHDYDNCMTDMSAEALAKRDAETLVFVSDLEAIDPGALSLEDRVDREMLLDHLRLEHFRYADLQEWRSDPLIYSSLVSDPVYDLLKRDFAPLEQRLRSALKRLKAIPRLLDQARANLDNPPRVKTEIAIQQAEGAIDLFSNVLTAAAAGTALADEVKTEAESAAAAVKSYRDWLREDLLPRSAGDWRLGAKLYDRLFEFEIGATLSPEEILKRAELDFEATLSEMRKLALENWTAFVTDAEPPADPDEAVRRVIEAMAADHPAPEDFIPALERAAADLKAFIKEHGIVRLPEPDRLTITPTPEFQAGLFHGQLDQPPPLDPEGQSIYTTSGSKPYPGPDGAERLEGFLREFNNKALVGLILHEGYPGHYVQGWYAGRCPSLVRKLFASGVYVEGWACYCERMILDEGFRGGDPGLKLQRLKMFLKMVSNAIIDIRLHRGFMEEGEVVPYLLERAFQTRGEAEAKLVRAKGTAVQLSTYYVGYLEMMGLRHEFKQQSGGQFDLGKYHEKVLTAGAPPMRLLRELILREEADAVQ